MITPRPRSSHNQVLDSRNKCGCEKTPQGCYSNATSPGSYCGPGCIGEACLYYAIGCFQGCGTCSYVGKTLYPVPSDLDKAGCNTPPPPTLGGGDATEEHKLRTYNIDEVSTFGDWTKWNPWRSPGSAGKGNPAFQPCGVNSGSNNNFPDPPAAGQAKYANGTDLEELPKSSESTWQAGSVVEAEWSIYANHGGGYSYRLCKKVAGVTPTEECYQRTPLEFATDTTEIKYLDGSRKPFFINATTTSKGTWPAGSQWRKNPIPMCNCDIGLFCGNKQADAKAAKDAMRFHQFTDIMETKADVLAAAGGKTCSQVIREQCGTKVGVNTCLKCGTKSDYDCEKCCPGLTLTTKTYAGKTYSYCTSNKPAVCSKDNPRACYSRPYPKSYLRPGQQAPDCPTGLHFPSSWDEGYGGGLAPHNFMWSMTDRLRVPDLEAGEYSLSWRWDCEQTPQVWNSCADITITK